MLEVPIGIILERPDKAKPKGRALEQAEGHKLKLGARGPKLKSRKCKVCGIADGHNATTCLQVEANRVRLSNLAGKKRGRPPGSKNRSTLGRAANEVDNQKRRRMGRSNDEDGNERVGTALDDNIQPEEPSPAPRKRGRPAGSKNKVNHLD
jgi:hypothetical protein